MWEIWRSAMEKSAKAREKLRNHNRAGTDSPLKTDSHNSHGNSPGHDGLTALSKAAEEQSRLREKSKTTQQQHINFKDLKLTLEDDLEPENEFEAPLLDEDGGAMSGGTTHRRKKLIEKHKLILILVGLPGRGKTFLCNKLMCYLNWLGHETRHFNVGMYRRKERHDGEVQDAAFFDHRNKGGMEARHRALQHALDDMIRWLSEENSQIAIFDATNTTTERRQYLIHRFHGNFSYMFIESICNDDTVLEENYKLKMRYSPDYQGLDQDQALRDFRERIRKYEEVYEPIEDRTLHYIKLIDMVTGRGHMDVNRISGYIPGKIVFFLMQVCKSGLCRPRKIWLTRHGESEYNEKGLIGGDSPLSALGEQYSFLLAEAIVDLVPMDEAGCYLPMSVWTSTLRRTIQTAEPLPFPKLRWKVLDEINAGACDGMTYEEIEEKMPDEYQARKRDKLRYRYPRGESYMDVIQRLEPCIIEVERERECVCIVAHQAILRVLYGYFTSKPLKDIPSLEIPLHTIIELTPRPDGTMGEARFPQEVTLEGAAGSAAERKERSNRGVRVRSESQHYSKADQGGLGVAIPPAGAVAIPVFRDAVGGKRTSQGGAINLSQVVGGSGSGSGGGTGEDWEAALSTPGEDGAGEGTPARGSAGDLAGSLGKSPGPGSLGSSSKLAQAHKRGSRVPLSRRTSQELSAPVDGAAASMLTPISYSLNKKPNDPLSP